MYINSGYLNNSRVPFKDKSKPLLVGSCGTYRLQTVKNCPHGDHVGDWTINYCMSFPVKHIFILMTRSVLLPQGIWFFFSHGRSSIMNTSERTRRKYTGFILLAATLKTFCGDMTFLWILLFSTLVPLPFMLIFLRR